MWMRILLFFRRRMALIPVFLIVVSVLVWLITRDTLPGTIRIATAQEGGLYHQFGEALKKSLEKRTGRRVELVKTEGSVENAQLLRDGKVEVAIVQGGSAPLRELSVIAPLYPEVVHVLARKGSSIEKVDDLKGHRVVYGPPGSGMRASAERVLKNYGILDDVIDSSDVYFKGLLDREEIGAAVVTTGFMNQDLQSVLAEGDFELLPLQSAKAIAVKDPFFQVTEIPRGLYREGTAIPQSDTQTVSTMAFLVGQGDANELLISRMMESIYEDGLEKEFPMLVSRNDALEQTPVGLHEVSRGYLNPPDRLGDAAQVMESMAAFKELSVALAAGLYLLWNRRKRRREALKAEYIQVQKDRLDVYLEKTLEIERAQMATDDIEELKKYLDQVTSIKLEALTKFTHEELRSDQSFSIFLMQCANLINKIQLKMMNCPSAR